MWETTENIQNKTNEDTVQALLILDFIHVLNFKIYCIGGDYNWD